MANKWCKNQCCCTASSSCLIFHNFAKLSDHTWLLLIKDTPHLMGWPVRLICCIEIFSSNNILTIKHRHLAIDWMVLQLQSKGLETVQYHFFCFENLLVADLISPSTKSRQCTRFVGRSRYFWLCMCLKYFKMTYLLSLKKFTRKNIIIYRRKACIGEIWYLARIGRRPVQFTGLIYLYELWL